MKVINILHHVAPPSVGTHEVLLNGWHAKFGYQVKKYYPKTRVECWLPSASGEVAIEKDGILFRTIKAFQPQFHMTICPSIISEIESSLEKDTIIHVFGERSFLTYYLTLMKRLDNKFPIVLHHLGAGGGRGLFGGSLISTGFSALEATCLPFADLIYTLSALRLRELAQLGIARGRLKCGQWGVDMNHFRPTSKEQCRDELGIRKETTIVLYVGRFDSLRGLEFVIQSVEQLKHKFDIELVAVGGSPTDPLAPMVERKLRLYRYRVPSAEMVHFYNAADVFAWFVSSSASRYAGTGISPLEAMACGIPVVSNTLVNLTEPIGPTIAYIPRNPAELAWCIEKAIDTVDNSSVRAYAERNFHWVRIIQSAMTDYSSVLSNYR